MLPEFLAVRAKASVSFIREEIEVFPDFFFFFSKFLRSHQLFYWSLWSVSVARGIILNNYKQMENPQCCLTRMYPVILDTPE